ncbi:unnamed protein product [Sphagnum troendelagicum]|uniref:Golgi SNAP receptor complex member 1 n=1 Tax=Sphagnum troendelagicum TaxID=128251 RepID=A0ABP0TV53_9BRYO
MDEGDGGSWEELRKEARKIEGDLDVKLSSYNKLRGMLARMGGDGSWKSMEMEIESLLEKLVDINDAMSQCVAAAVSTTSVTQKLARHRDILHEFSQEFQRTRNNMSSTQKHAELLTSVRNDISEYKVCSSSSPLEIMLQLLGMQVDEVISQAQATKGALAAQHSAFMEIQGKLKQLGDRLPVIRSLLGAIKRKRSKDTSILAGVITVCSFLIIIYWVSK